jgi:hypothetical protein
VKRRRQDPRAYRRLAELCDALGWPREARGWRRASSERFGPEGRNKWAKRRRDWQAAMPAASAPVWCVVANVVEERRAGPFGSEMWRGTRHFAPGAKVYVITQLDEGQTEVVGHHRKAKRYVSAVVSTEALTGARAKCVYSPHVIRELRGLWDGGEASRERAGRVAQFINDCSTSNRPKSGASETRGEEV